MLRPPHAVALAVAGGCAGDEPRDSAPPGREFSVLAEQIPVPALLSAWSEGDTVLFAGGTPGEGPGVLGRYDGARLCVGAETERTLWWIAGADDGRWWAVGEAGTVLMGDASGARAREDVPTDATLFGVQVQPGEPVGADGLPDVIAVGGSFSADGSVGEVWRRRDGAWSLLVGGLDGAAFKIWNGWIVGDGAAWRLEGESLQPADLGGGRLLTVRGRADDDVWAVGGNATADIRHWDGSSWSVADSSAFPQALNGVWTGPDEDVFVAGNYGTAAVWTGASWTLAEVPTLAHFHAAWKQASTDEVLFVGGDLFGDRDGTATVLRYGPPGEPVRVEDCAESARAAIGPVPWLSLIARAEAAPAVKAGTLAPALTLDGIPGPLDLTAFRGRPVALNFWASWCAPCLAELPALDAAFRAGAPIVAISLDREIGVASGVVRRLGLRLPVGFDPKGSVAAAWSPPALPVTYVLDGQGVVRAVHQGALPDVSALVAELEAL